MPKKLAVTLPDGTIATRSTNRTYTHAVVCRRSQAEVDAAQKALDAALARVTPEMEADWAALEARWNKAVAPIRANHAAFDAWHKLSKEEQAVVPKPEMLRASSWAPGGQSPEWVEYDQVSRLAQKHPMFQLRDLDGYAGSALVRTLESAKASIGSCYVAGWCGRLDLAEKLAQSERARNAYLEVQIVPTFDAPVGTKEGAKPRNRRVGA